MWRKPARVTSRLLSVRARRKAWAPAICSQRLCGDPCPRGSVLRPVPCRDRIAHTQPARLPLQAIAGSDAATLESPGNTGVLARQRLSCRCAELVYPIAVSVRAWVLEERPGRGVHDEGLRGVRRRGFRQEQQVYVHQRRVRERTAKGLGAVASFPESLFSLAKCRELLAWLRRHVSGARSRPSHGGAA